MFKFEICDVVTKCSFLNMFEEEGGGLQSHDPSL